jgi:hypothetical protein
MGNIETASKLPQTKISFSHKSKNLLLKNSSIFKSSDDDYILSYFVEDFDESKKKYIGLSHNYLLKTYCLETEMMDIFFFNNKNRRIFTEYLPFTIRDLVNSRGFFEKNYIINDDFYHFFNRTFI